MSNLICKKGLNNNERSNNTKTAMPHVNENLADNKKPKMS